MAVGDRPQYCDQYPDKTATRNGRAGGGDWQRSLDEAPAADDPLSSQFDLETRREVYRWAAGQVRESVSPSTWSAFHLTHVQGVSIAEAAGQLRTSVGNVYIARSRVMSRLRELAQQFEATE